MGDPIKLPPGAVLVDDQQSGMKLPPGATLVADTGTPPSAPDRHEPEARTAGNYGAEILYGAGRGIKNDVAGAFQTAMHPIKTASDLYSGTIKAVDAAKKEEHDLQDAYPRSGVSPTRSVKNNLVRGGAAMLTFLDSNPLTGSMVQRAESGSGIGSPESVGAGVEGAVTFATPELLGKGLKGAATGKFVTEKIPTGLVNQLIRPMAADVKFGKNPARAILREGLVGNTLEQLGDNTYAKLREIGPELDKQAKLPTNASKVVDAQAAIKPVDEAMADAAKAGNLKLWNSLKDMRYELTTNFKPFRDAKGNVSLRPAGPRNLQMSPAEALEFKRQVADRIRWDGNDPFNNDLNGVRGEVYGKLKDSVNTAVPGLRELNERYSDLVGAAKAIERRSTVAARNHAWSLSDIALGASGHVPLAIARKGLNHPAVTTRVARGLYDMGH